MLNWVFKKKIKESIEGTWETIILVVIILKCQEKYSLGMTDIKYQLTNIKKGEDWIGFTPNPTETTSLYASLYRNFSRFQQA